MKRNFNIHLPQWINVGVVSVVLFAASGLAYADDTEIYFQNNPSASQIRPNIYFVLDDSGSMGASMSGTTKMAVLRNTMRDLITKLAVDDKVNVGFESICLYYGNGSMGKRYPIVPVGPNKNNLIAATDQLRDYCMTPFVAAMYGSYRNMAPQIASAPVCQKDAMVLMSDGEPNDPYPAAQIRTLISGNQTERICSGTNSAAAHHECMRGIAEYMLKRAPNKIATHAIYFDGRASDHSQFRATSVAGGGLFYTANNASQLLDAFKVIIDSTIVENATLVGPAVSSGDFRMSGYNDALFFAMFKPVLTDNWSGNVKRYAVSSSTTGQTLVKDVMDQIAIDPITSLFKSTAKSYWSTEVDGVEVAKGGAANMQANSRTNLYTYLDVEPAPGTTNSNSLISLTVSNPSFTPSLFGAADVAEKNRVINWLVTSKASAAEPVKKRMADVIHSRPRVFTASQDTNITRIQANTRQDKVVIAVGTNEGFLHLLDAATGAELASFIPQELLDNPLRYLKNEPAVSNKQVYGMDGQISVDVEYVPTADANGMRKASQIFLYAGMGRGGRSYYALEYAKTSAYDLKLKWVIKGGQTPGFAKLGQTWAEMKPSMVKWNGSIKKVLFFAGGYDVNQDNQDIPFVARNDGMGNAIYMVDAVTGLKLWSASSSGESLNIPGMNNSIPSGLALLDPDGDGIDDIIYAADTGGRIFRIDINQTNNGASNFAKGGIIAELAGNGELNNRKFYNIPDVAKVQSKLTGALEFWIGIGSGYRGHPLNKKVQDRIYGIRDAIKAPTGAYTTVTHSDLVDATTPNAGIGHVVPVDKRGWYINLNATTGEKALSDGMIFNHTLIISTYEPTIKGGISTDPCVAPAPVGIGRTYMVHIDTARAAMQNASGQEERSFELKLSAIPPEPQLIYTRPATGGEAKPTILIGYDIDPQKGGNGGGGGGGPAGGPSNSCTDKARCPTELPKGSTKYWIEH